MAKIINMDGIKRADALIADAVRCNPHVFDRLTLGDIEMAFNETTDKKTELITLRIPKLLLDQFDELVREQAYKKKNVSPELA